MIKTQKRIEKGKKPVYVYVGISLKTANEPTSCTSDEDSWNLLCHHYSFPGWFKSNANSTAVEFVRGLPLFCQLRTEGATRNRYFQGLEF